MIVFIMEKVGSSVVLFIPRCQLRMLAKAALFALGKTSGEVIPNDVYLKAQALMCLLYRSHLFKPFCWLVSL